MKVSYILPFLLLASCKEEIPRPVVASIASPKAKILPAVDSVIVSKPIIALKPVIVDTDGNSADIFIMLPPVMARESFDVIINEAGKSRKVKVNYEIGKDSTREYAQIYNSLDIRFSSEIPLNLAAKVESYESRYHTMNTEKISPIIPTVKGNLFSFNLEKLKDDKVFNLVIYAAGKQVHFISFEKYPFK